MGMLHAKMLSFVGTGIVFMDVCLKSTEGKLSLNYRVSEENIKMWLSS